MDLTRMKMVLVAKQNQILNLTIMTIEREKERPKTHPMKPRMHLRKQAISSEQVPKPWEKRSKILIKI